MGSFSFKKNKFIIENYEAQKPFSSFLPGIAGVNGIPMWTFYVNRGQCISSFGVQDKNSPMMEFAPASVAYKEVYTRGFRTFVKYDSDNIHEPFSSKQARAKMKLSMGMLEISDMTDNLECKVSYCNVPGRDFAGLLRKVELKNTSDKSLSFECLDGLPEILPYGTKNEDYKENGHLLRSWMEVDNLDKSIPFFKLRASTEDETQVTQFSSGHFTVSWNGQGDVLPVIVDMENIFGQDTSLQEAQVFKSQSVFDIFSKDNITANKLPGHFTGGAYTLAPNETCTVYTLFGHTADIERVNVWVEAVDLVDFAFSSFIESESTVTELTDDIETKSGHPVFDQYCRQSYLDNVMRGGYPISLGEAKKNTYYVFSRKHGDQERDYNFFSISPEYYSQGNGNFRDVNQNRRNDVFFHPDVEDHNIKLFYDLIQLDGYNPLVIEGQLFRLDPKQKQTFVSLLQKFEFEDKEVEAVLSLVKTDFSPGALFARLKGSQRFSTSKSGDNDLKRLFDKLMDMTSARYWARHSEGFWSDHWTYNLDLIESYLAIYPDRLMNLFFYDKTYKYYDSPVRVLPRYKKYEKAGDKLRQYHATELDLEKLERLKRNENDSCWVKTDYGHGQTFHTSLIAKLVGLVFTKFTLVDPYGMGLEMEAGKPGWNDALNGLPGLFGSSMAEQVELQRLVDFLIGLEDKVSDKKEPIDLPLEVLEHWNQMMILLDKNLSGAMTDQDYWDKSRSVLENYREMTRFGVSGETVTSDFNRLLKDLKRIHRKLVNGGNKAQELGQGLLPTFFTFDWRMEDDTLTLEKCTTLPHFLEGPARALKNLKRDEAKSLHKSVEKSDLYDQGLKMYKTSVSIEGESHEIGRIRAFTPGWLERESVFLHMEYKYLLGLLKSGQYEDFFKTFKEALIPFQDPEKYGRPTTENVSFIASTNNPDPGQHGRGHMARLSGSTAEFIHMWLVMMIGERPFELENNELTFKLQPHLPEWIFNENMELTFKLFGKTLVTYKNQKRKATYGEGCTKVESIQLVMDDGQVHNFSNNVKGHFARALREGRVQQMLVTLN